MLWLRCLVVCACSMGLRIGEISEREVGVRVTGEPRHAYFVMVGPMDETRSYRPWFFSALALLTALRSAGAAADAVVLLAARRDGGRRHEPVRLLAGEEAMLRRVSARWRYVEPPGPPFASAGFHMGNYKLVAWQHLEYDVVQLFDADLLPTRDMDDLFALPRMLGATIAACPGKVSPINAGWLVFEPNVTHYEQLLALLARRDASRELVAPWGRELDSWRDASDTRHGAGWRFFDSIGNQGHLYSYFRFEARSLALILNTREGHALRIFAPHDTDAELGRPGARVGALLDEGFPCPFPQRKSIPRAYIHFTGSGKPWIKFSPHQAHFAMWYSVLTRNGADATVLPALFPKVDPLRLATSLRSFAAGSGGVTPERRPAGPVPDLIEH